MILLAILWLLPAIAQAQDRAWVQIEAHPSLVEAQTRARDYARLLSDVNGFALGGPWYGVALGPYEPEAAEATLRRLRADGLIPRDSYVSDGEGYRDQFWPVGLQGRPAAGEAPPPAVAAPVAEAPTAVVAPAQAPPVEEETLAEAQRSEAALSREEKMALQGALQWFGHYGAAIDGSFGAGTRTSMAEWQASVGGEPTGVLTTRQRASLLDAQAEAQAALGLIPLTVSEAGLALTAPMRLVEFERIEAPFVHYRPRGGSDVQMSLVSQPGDATTLAGLYEIMQTLSIVPEAGEREREADRFRITGVAPDRTTEVRARLEGDHIVGFVLSWPEAQDARAARAVPEMERTLRSTGAPLPQDTGFVAAEQDVDMVSGFEVRAPLRTGSGFFVDGKGTVVTAAGNVDGCGRVTIGDRFESEVAARDEAVAILRPERALAPAEVARLAPEDGRLRSAVAVAGFPYGGVLGAATLTRGTLEDVRGLDGEADLLRLSIPAAEPGEAGGPVLDAAGRVAGMLLPMPVRSGRILPGDVAFALKSARLAALLREAGIPAPLAKDDATPVAPEALAARAAAVAVLVSCWE